jgi:toxin ParE1/3/4
LNLKWTKRALAQFKEAETYIAQENPQAAAAVAKRIAAATQLLRENPEIGRLGRVQGTREWIVKRTPYLIAYTTEGENLIILRIIHGKQRWPLQID